MIEQTRTVSYGSRERMHQDAQRCIEEGWAVVRVKSLPGDSCEVEYVRSAVDAPPAPVCPIPDVIVIEPPTLPEREPRDGDEPRKEPEEIPPEEGDQGGGRTRRRDRS